MNQLHHRLTSSLFLITPFSLFFLLFLHSEITSGELVVGTREIPPFAIQDESGNWSGITIELWEKIAEELNLSFRYEPVTLTNAFERLQDGTIDAAAAAFSITSEREAIIDFSHPFYTTGLGIAVRSRQGSGFRSIVRGFFSRGFIEAVAVLAFLLFIFGFLLWVFEKKKNRAQFGGKGAQGIGAGFWWSAVTMTTVGYGDKAPVTVCGRIVALIWMFSGIIIISTITASITSALTVASLDSGISGPDDLKNAAAGTVQNSTSADYLYENGIQPIQYKTVNGALDALFSGEIEAVVYDAPILTYIINRHYPGKLSVLPSLFEQQHYGIALPFESPMRQDINRVLLSLIERGDLKKISLRYLGR